MEAPADRTHDWEAHWQRYAAATRLNPGQHYRRRLILDLLTRTGIEPGMAVLDAGCGSGDLLESIAKRFPGCSVGGIDGSAKGIEMAQRALPAARFACGNLGAGSEPVATFTAWADRAICSEVLEHVDDPVAVLAAVRICMKHGGYLIVTVPGGPRTAFDRAIGHLRHYTRHDAADMVRDSGFIDIHTRAAGFPFFNAYRTVVLMRGERLAADIAGEPGMAARSAMAMFRGLMPFNLNDCPWGWQIAVVARAP